MSTQEQTSPLKKRKLWWLHADFFWFIGSYVACSAFFLSIVRISKLAFELTGIFWLIMLPIIIWLYRRTIFEDYSVDQSIVRRTRRGILAHRVKVQEDYFRQEIALLRRGVKTAVLDVWRLNPEIGKQHPFFSCAEVIAIDPECSELHIRIQLEDWLLPSENPRNAPEALKANALEFLSIISEDPYLAALRRFFNTLIIEIYGLRPHDLLGIAPYPVLSMAINARGFWRISASSRVPEEISRIANLRFNKGQEIVPHRSIEPPKSTSK